MFEVEGCPKKYVGSEMAMAINYAAFAQKGQWPILGGTLDQAAWFVSLVASLDAEQNKIDVEEAERFRNG